MAEKKTQLTPTEVNIQIGLFTQTLEYIKQDIKEIKEKLDNKYVTKEEFSTVKSIVYGMVSIVLVSFVGAVVAFVLK